MADQDRAEPDVDACLAASGTSASSQSLSTIHCEAGGASLLARRRSRLPLAHALAFNLGTLTNKRARGERAIPGLQALASIPSSRPISHLPRRRPQPDVDEEQEAPSFRRCPRSSTAAPTTHSPPVSWLSLAPRPPVAPPPLLCLAFRLSTIFRGPVVVSSLAH